MCVDHFTKRFRFIGTILLLAACTEQSTPIDPLAREAIGATASVGTSNVFNLQQTTDPFTIRASLDPYRIHQLPDFMVHSRVQADLVIQRLVLPPGSVPWHTHPGPSFVIVEAGQITTSFYSPRTGCVESAVLGPGQAFYRAGDEIHRLTVVSAGDAVLYVARFNIPVGAAITVPANDPGC